MFMKKHNQLDFKLLNINKSDYDKSEDKLFKSEKSVCEITKYVNENPTPWNLDHIYDYSDEDFDIAVERGYIEKIMCEDFSKHFEKFTKKELILQSQSFIDPEISKGDVIKLLAEEGEYSWVITDKGLSYLNSNPLYVFFTNHLLKYNLYEFVLFARANDGLDLEELGDKYINLKLEKSLTGNYLNYIDYYHTLYLKNGDYYNALVYLIQRIIYLTNSWLLEDYHVAFDEVYDLETFYLLFNFTKLNLDLDFENAYKNAFNEFKIPELRINYNRLHDISYRLLINGEDQYEISGDLLEESKKEGKFKSFSFF